MLRNFFLILLCLLPFEISQAQEGGGEAPAAEGSKPAPAKKEEVSAQQEVLELQAKLQSLKTKIAAKKDILKKLVEEKQTSKDEKASFEVFNQMKTEYKDLQASIKDYDENLSLLNYRYPEKGLNKERKYERIEIKSLDEMESEFSLQGKIKKTMARVRQQFPLKKGQKIYPAAGSGVPEAAPVKVVDPSRTSVTEPLLLSK